MKDRYPFGGLGATVRAVREKKQLSQKRCAEFAGVSRRHLADFEKGANVSLLVAQKVLSTLQISTFKLGESEAVIPLKAVDATAVLHAIGTIEELITQLTQAVADLRSQATSSEERDELSIEASRLLRKYVDDVKTMEPADQLEALQRLPKSRTLTNRRRSKTA